MICYIDDIVVIEESEEDHLRNLDEVLQRLKKHGMKLHLD